MLFELHQCTYISYRIIAHNMLFHKPRKRANYEYFSVFPSRGIEPASVSYFLERAFIVRVVCCTPLLYNVPRRVEQGIDNVHLTPSFCSTGPLLYLAGYCTAVGVRRGSSAAAVYQYSSTLNLFRCVISSKTPRAVLLCTVHHHFRFFCLRAFNGCLPFSPFFFFNTPE